MPDHPNIVWITLDSVRADHTSLLEHYRDTTPRLRELAEREDAVHLGKCFTEANWTPAASASIMTGVYPSRHGVPDRNDVIPGQLTPVSERFSEAGYWTGCYSRNTYMSHITGLDRGYDEFRYVSGSTMLSDVDVRTLAKYLVNLRRHSAGFTPDTAKHSTPFIINDMAKRRLRDLQTRDQPYFLYLHYNEPHRPYYPPLTWLETYEDDFDMDPSKAAAFSMDVHRNLDEYIADGCPFSEAEWSVLRAMYDTELAYTDDSVGRLIDELHKDTIVVVTADHGEQFGEYGLLSHKVSLHDALIHVPMVVAGPGISDAISEQEDELVQHLDVMRYLLTRAGADVDGYQGIDLRRETRDHVIAQRGDSSEHFKAFREHDPDFDLSRYHEGLATCIRTDRYKYVTSEGKSELFELPDETDDVSDQHESIVADLQNTLRSWFKSDGEYIQGDESVTMSDSMRRQLRDLGYLDG